MADSVQIERANIANLLPVFHESIIEAEGKLKDSFIIYVDSRGADENGVEYMFYYTIHIENAEFYYKYAKTPFDINTLIDIDRESQINLGNLRIIFDGTAELGEDGKEIESENYFVSPIPENDGHFEGIFKTLKIIEATIPQRKSEKSGVKTRSKVAMEKTTDYSMISYRYIVENVAIAIDKILKTTKIIN
jgi:hypothetical protein